jgi:hypothetical protein
MNKLSPMTLGNMRANGVRALAAWCLGRGCNHFRALDVSGYSDDVPVLSILAQLDAFRVDMVECWKPRLKRVTENNVQKDHKTCRCPGKQS